MADDTLNQTTVSVLFQDDSSSKTRWCSSVVKIDVLSRVIGNYPAYASGKFLVCTGERWQESPARKTLIPPNAR